MNRNATPLFLLSVYLLSTTGCIETADEPGSVSTETNTSGTSENTTGSSGESIGSTDTVEPETETTSESSTQGDSTSTGSTTEWAPANCTNNVHDPNEECDHGPDNGWNAECTPECTHAYCGDGNVLELGENPEECDEGADNGDDYGKCTEDCIWGPRCGDGAVDVEFGEMCDSMDLNGITCADGCRLNAKLVFITGTPYTGALGDDPNLMNGVEAADAICNELGQSLVEGLETEDGTPVKATFRAWISAGENSVASRFSTSESQPYVMPNGIPIANNWSQLIDGAIDNPIIISETGEMIMDQCVWTNTKPDGTTLSNADSCVGWTQVGFRFEGMIGYNYEGYEANGYWTAFEPDDQGQYKCFNECHLYCFEQ